jgi:predicted helicase
LFSSAGKKLADLHLHYETQPRYAGLVWEQTDRPHYRVEKMRPRNKRKIALAEIFPLTQPLPDAQGKESSIPIQRGGITDAQGKGQSQSSLDAAGGDIEGGQNNAEVTVFESLQYNNTLTITGIPAAAFSYRLGKRSALEWVIDQYQVKTDKRSGITSDPNGYSDDDQYIVKLVERVIHVSVETVAIVAQLAAWPFREEG